MTIKRTFWLVAMTLLSLTAHAQHFDWVKSYSGTDPTGKLWNYIVSSVTDSRGNLYVAGQFANGASIAGHELLPITPHGSQCDNLNAAIIKFSPDGQILGANHYTQMTACLAIFMIWFLLGILLCM